MKQDALHGYRILAGTRPTRPSLTEARTGISEYERRRAEAVELEEGRPYDPDEDPRHYTDRDLWRFMRMIHSGDPPFEKSVRSLTKKPYKAYDAIKRELKRRGLPTTWAKLRPMKFDRQGYYSFVMEPGAKGVRYTGGAGYGESLEEATSLRDQHADAKKRARLHPKSGWGKHARKLLKKIKAKQDEQAEGEELEAKRPTFKVAKAAILDYLRKEGWKMSGPLKIPHATSPDGKLRFWFKSQAVHYSWEKHKAGNARSLDLDIRRMSPEEFTKDAERRGRKWGPEMAHYF
jgi:hypothetical protein